MVENWWIIGYWYVVLIIFMRLCVFDMFEFDRLVEFLKCVLVMLSDFVFVFIVVMNVGWLFG